MREGGGFGWGRGEGWGENADNCNCTTIKKSHPLYEVTAWLSVIWSWCNLFEKIISYWWTDAPIKLC